MFSLRSVCQISVLTLNLSYVINSEAMKKLYKTMKGRPTEGSEPRDLGREWHSDSLLLPNT